MGAGPGAGVGLGDGNGDGARVGLGVGFTVGLLSVQFHFFKLRSFSRTHSGGEPPNLSCGVPSAF